MPPFSFFGCSCSQSRLGDGDEQLAFSKTFLELISQIAVAFSENVQPHLADKDTASKTPNF